MTLRQLGEEYLKQAQVLSTLIDGYSAQIKDLSGIKLYELNSRLIILKEMERDTRITGRQLVEYYEKPQGGRRYRRHENSRTYR